jgi:hypothetical protein
MKPAVGFEMGVRKVSKGRGGDGTAGEIAASPEVHRFLAMTMVGDAGNRGRNGGGGVRVKVRGANPSGASRHLPLAREAWGTGVNPSGVARHLPLVKGASVQDAVPSARTGRRGRLPRRRPRLLAMTIDG